MKSNITPMKALFVALACMLLAGMPTVASAQSEEAVKAKELELKQKELELEKAKLDAARTEQLAVEKAKVELAQKELELAKAKQDLAVQENAQELRMQLSGDVLFDTNEATIKADAREKLRQVGVILAAYPKGQVTVTGFADARGSEEVNLDLSKARADAVKTYLMNQSGVTVDRIAVKAMGEEGAVASNATAEGRKMNRRVEIAVGKPQ